MSPLVLNMLQDAFFAALAGIGFAILSNPPLRAFFATALLAALAHSARFLLMHRGMDIALATFFVSFGVGLLSIPLAHQVHTPPDVFSFPSLLPMIPGIFAYKTILGLIKLVHVTDNTTSLQILLDTIHNGLKTGFILLALAVGVSLPMLILGAQSVNSTRIRRIFAKNRRTT